MIIEKVVNEYLQEALEMDEVYNEDPDGIEPPYVVIEKTGAGQENLINRSTLAIKSYGASLYETILLNDQVKAAMDVIDSAILQISDSSLDSDYDYSDTAKKRYRYQAVYNLIHY